MRLLRPFMTYLSAAFLVVVTFLARLFDELKPEPFEFRSTPAMPLAMAGGDQISASAFQGLRHESRVRRRSADRNS